MLIIKISLGETNMREELVIRTTNGIYEIINDVDRLNFIKHFLPREVAININDILKTQK